MTSLDARLAPHSPKVLSIFRIIFGLLFTLYGTSKLFGWPMALEVPVGDWPVWWAGLIEFVTGILITVGFQTRLAAFIASGEMAVAYFWKHWPPLEGPAKPFWPHLNDGIVPVMFCFGFLLLATTGAGLWSVDSRRRGAYGAGYTGAGYAGTTAAQPVTTTGTAQRVVPQRRGLAGLRDRFSRRRY
ncbi:DoxX family protein [Mycobacterium sp. MYCO198283]|uniref:DoxX family protein n=1 Tax=Mycobacterium sp. MYCO198283 TaxID=2883505 RepID=UPI001E6335B7|nr:DoxX family protein [Mycobacterium sp. MYCO198283]MCG5432669.1 DoxX family protein [Mycobacterium sp. MYCO198283]